MAKSKLQLTMEGDIEDMRQRAQDCREQAETLIANARGLEGQVDNYETLIKRADDYEPGAEQDDDEPESDEDEPDEEAQSY